MWLSSVFPLLQTMMRAKEQRWGLCSLLQHGTQETMPSAMGYIVERPDNDTDILLVREEWERKRLVMEASEGGTTFSL